MGWKKALFYEKLEGYLAKCTLCHRLCIICEGQTGFCHAYMNVEGDLYSVTYGRPLSVLIEASTGIFMTDRHPTFRYNRQVAVSTPFCNFRCKLCPNSKAAFMEQPPFVHPLAKGFHCFRGDECEPYFTIEMSPEDIVAGALMHECEGVRFSYNEATVFFEYLLDIAKLAKKAGLRVSVETNGYMTEKPIETLAPYVDVVVVSFKASGSQAFYDGIDGPHVLPRFETIRRFKRLGVWTSVVDILVEGLDSVETVGDFCQELAGWAGKDEKLLLGVAVDPKQSFAPPMIERQEKWMWAFTCALDHGFRDVTFVETIPTYRIRKGSLNIT